MANEDAEVTARKRNKNPDFISTSDVVKRVAQIEKQYKEGNTTDAQLAEAELHKDVLTAIATKNCTNVMAMAALAVKIFRT